MVITMPKTMSVEDKQTVREAVKEVQTEITSKYGSTKLEEKDYQRIEADCNSKIDIILSQEGVGENTKPKFF